LLRWLAEQGYLRHHAVRQPTARRPLSTCYSGNRGGGWRGGLGGRFLAQRQR
jgi:hypothetical protein